MQQTIALSHLNAMLNTLVAHLLPSHSLRSVTVVGPTISFFLRFFSSSLRFIQKKKIHQRINEYVEEKKTKNLFKEREHRG